MQTLTLQLNDPAETRAVGLALGAALPKRAIVLLCGPLGAGKTTLAKALCEALGIRPEVVISPTYTLVNIYPGPASVYHVDLFRLEDPGAMLEMDRDDWINPDGVTLIEWPEPARPLLAGEACLEVELALGDEGRDVRRLTLRGVEHSHEAVFAALERWRP